MLWNSTISTQDARYMCADCASFYLETPMEHFEYMHVKIELVPQAFINEYQLHNNICNGYVYTCMEI